MRAFSGFQSEMVFGSENDCARCISGSTCTLLPDCPDRLPGLVIQYYVGFAKSPDTFIDMFVDHLSEVHTRSVRM